MKTDKTFKGKNKFDSLDNHLGWFKTNSDLEILKF